MWFGHSVTYHSLINITKFYCLTLKLFVTRDALYSKINFMDTAPVPSLDTRHVLADQLHLRKRQNCVITIVLTC